EEHDEETLRAYLLGELTPQEAAEVEDRLVADDGLFELAEAIEAELLDAEARGALTPSDQSPLRKLGSSAWGRRRRHFSGALAAIDLRETVTPRNRFAQLVKIGAPALALAASLVAVVGLRQHWTDQQMPPQSTSPPIGSPMTPTPAPAPAPKVVQLWLGSSRSEEALQKVR